MRRLFARLLLVCFLFSLMPLAEAVDTPRSRAKAARRARHARSVKRHKRARAKWGKARKAHVRTARV